MSTTNCAHCGVRMPSTASRCPECGAPATGAAADLPRHTGAAETGRPAQTRSPGCSLAIGLGVGALVVGGGALAVLFVGGLVMRTEAPVATPDAPPVTAVAEAPTPAPGPPVAPGSGGFAAVKARGELRVAADPDAPPFFSATDGGQEGFEYGLMSAIAAEIGVPLKLVSTDFGNLPTAVTSGAADLAIGQVSPATHWPGVSYSVSYLQYSLCLVVPQKSKVARLPDLVGKKVGTWDDPAVDPVLRSSIGAYVQLTFTDDGYFESLEHGDLDAVVYDCPLARYELAKHPKLRIADDAINVATYSVVTNAQDPVLLADVNRVLRKLGDQGLLAKLEERWLGKGSAATTTATGKVTIVQHGDTLATIAQRELGDASKAAELHDRNRDLLGDDPNALYAGLRLRIGP